MTTVQQVYDRAHAKSMKNNPGVVAAEPEIIGIVKLAQRGLFAVAARVSPTFFGATADVAYSAPGWLRPAAAESVDHVTVVSSGAAVSMVPHDDLLADHLKPSIYKYGSIYRSVGRSNDPTATDSLRFFYSRRPTDPTLITSDLDSSWPEQHDELMVLEAAIYLAGKDSTEIRTAELAALKEQRKAQLIQFIAYLEHETANVVRRHSRTRRVNLDSLLTLLAGGGK